MQLSIVTINLNHAVGLRRTIESVLCQSFDDFEFIVIDGASTDSSAAVIAEYRNYIDFAVSEPDKGIYSAMNKGIVKSKGDYILFLNSGDYLEDEVLERVFSEINDEMIVYGDFYTSKDGKRAGQCFVQPDELTMLNFFGLSIQHNATFIRRSLFENELYDEHYRIVSDRFFFIQKIIIENCTYKHLRFPVIYYELDGYASKEENQPLHLQEVADMLNHFLPQRVQTDYKRMQNIRQLKLDVLADDFASAKWFRRWSAHGIVCLTISYIKIRNFFEQN